MPQVYLVMRRTDIPEGVLQVVDLWPNTSSRNQIYTPGLGQTGYVRNIPFTSLVGNVDLGPAVVATADLNGLAAYLIGNIDPTAVAGSPVFTAVQADTAAAGLIAIAEAGTILDTAAVDAVLAGVVAGTSLTGGGSTGGITLLLDAMAGRVYTILAGTAISDGAGDFAGQVGDFEANDTEFLEMFDTGRFKVSNLNGNISLMKSANFTYLETTGAAITVYAADGTLYV